MRICVIVGTRPQIIKSQPVINQLLKKRHQVVVIHTGQHYDYEMSKGFFDEMKIKDPDFNLGVKVGSSAQQVAQIISKLENPLKKINPDCVIVPGDTRSALAAALCANRLGLKIAHLEAGARSHDFSLEEEINRRIVDNCSDLLFAPTKNCFNNLKKEGILGSSYFTGDTMYDVLLEYKKILKLKKPKKKKFILMTIHRQNTISNPKQMKNIINLVKKIVKSGEEVIFPIHPHTKKQIKSFKISLKGINTIKPVKYSKMLQLVNDAKLLITDSGGLQKEAFWLKTPCVTIRKNTEWIETLQGKRNIVMNKITNSSFDLITKMYKKNTLQKNSSKSPFGNGNASKKIVSILSNYLRN